jgi:hypothetical protein
MGEEAMSDVEKRIEQWREGLAGSELLSGSDVNELESHLRDGMEHLKTAGLSDNEAFLVARHRLGDTIALEEEFAKVNSPRRLRDRLCWMIAGVLAYWVAVHFASAASGIALAIAQATSGNPGVMALIAGGVRIVAFCGMTGLMVWMCARYFRPGGPARIQITRRVQIVFLVALLFATVGLTIARVFGVAYVIRTLPVADYSRIAMMESYGNITWRFAGPVLLGVLLMVIHVAGREKAKFQ